MPDTKLSDLTAATPAGADLVYVVDVSDPAHGPAGSSRKATLDSVFGQITFAAVGSGFEPAGAARKNDPNHFSVSQEVGVQDGRRTVVLAGGGFECYVPAAVVNSFWYDNLAGGFTFGWGGTTCAVGDSLFDFQANEIRAANFTGGGANLTGLNASQLTTGTVPVGALPAVAISEFLGAVGSQAAMLALTGQRGDWAYRTDETKTYILIGDDASQLANWKEVLTPGGAAWGAITGTLSSQTDLQTALDLKAPLANPPVTGQATFVASATTDVPVTVRGTGAHTGDLLRIRNPANSATIAKFNAAGSLYIVGASGEFPIIVRNTTDTATVFSIENSNGSVTTAGTVQAAVGFRASAFGAYMGVSAAARWEFQSGYSRLYFAAAYHVLSPAQITADQNNYAPAGGPVRFLRLSTDASRTVTGISGYGQDGMDFEIWNVGSNDLVLAHESASSTAANRFLCSTGASITLTANQSAVCRYDSTSARIRVWKRA